MLLVWYLSSVQFVGICSFARSFFLSISSQPRLQSFSSKIEPRFATWTVCFNSIFHHDTCHGVLGLLHSFIHPLIHRKATHSLSTTCSLPRSFPLPLPFPFPFPFPLLLSSFPPNIRTTPTPHPPSLSRATHPAQTKQNKNGTRERERANVIPPASKQAGSGSESGPGWGWGWVQAHAIDNTMDVYIYI